MHAKVNIFKSRPILAGSLALFVLLTCFHPFLVRLGFFNPMNLRVLVALIVVLSLAKEIKTFVLDSLAEPRKNFLILCILFFSFVGVIFHLENTWKEIGLFGFLIGLTPRWIGLYANSISGHAGYELDLGLPQMWHKLSNLVSVQLPNILEFDSSYLGMLVAVLMGVAVFNFLRRDKGGVEIIFAILPILLLSASIIYQKPHTVRHLFPIYGVVVFYISSFLFRVEKKSAHSFWVLLVFLGSYYGYATYSYYKDLNIINGFSILKKDTITDDLIRYARKKQFQAVYTDYSAHKLQFLSGGNPNFVEFHSNPEHGLVRREKMGEMPNFAVFVPEGKHLAVYESHLKDRKISCHRENLYQYLVLSRCLGNPFDVYKLRLLGRL